jgi:2-iminobutanoate/2-iminopropanoate deaminase
MASEALTQPEREAVSPSSEFPFSEAIIYGGLVFTSGAIGRDPRTGEIARGDIAAQTTQTMENIRCQLQAAGTCLEQVLKVTIFVCDMSLFETMNKAYRSFFPAEPPARSCVEVTALADKDALVEIEVVAGR